MALEEDTDNPFGDESFGLDISVPGDAGVQGSGSSLDPFAALDVPRKTPDVQPEEDNQGLLKSDALSLDFQDISGGDEAADLSGQIPTAQIVAAPASVANVQYRAPATTGGAPTNPQAPQEKTGCGPCGCCSMNFFQQYFDVDTSDITERLLNTLNLRQKTKFLRLTYSNPDMYGPFWIATTLIVVLAVASNLNSFLAQLEFGDHGSNSTTTTMKETWHYDIHKPSMALSLVYIYIPSAGLCVWFLLQYLDIKMPDVQTGAAKSLPLVNTLCLTGYSFLPYLPILVFCIMPYNALEMAALLVACVYSWAILFRELWPLIQESSPEGTACGRGKAQVVGFAVALGFAIFSVICWFAFFF